MMRFSEVKLIPIKMEEREQFIRDNQWSFKHGALIEFGERDNHIDESGEVISCQTIKMCMFCRKNIAKE